MIIRFLIFLALFWLISRALKLFSAPANRPEARPTWPPEANRVVGGELVQDPRCGVYVPRETAVKGRDGACFCSEACRDAHERGKA